MSSELIKTEVKKAKEEFYKYKGSNITDDKAFSYMLLSIFFDLKSFDDKFDCVTDGSSDGGIDFIYFDEDEIKLFICQSKYTESLSYVEIKNEFDKICDTINNFKRSKTRSYNETLKRVLQNAIDRLPDDEQDNIEINLFTVATDVIDTENIIEKLKDDISDLDKFSFSIYSKDDIENKIQEHFSKIPTVSYAKIEIDKAKNYLEYENEYAKGIMVNIKSASLVGLYNKYQNSGLFDMNIRRYIVNHTIDEKIIGTLNKNRSDFWFLNNGIVIACEEFSIDGNKVNLFNFSIVNGGQTTYLIGKYKGKNTEKFCIPCKIVAEKKRHSEVPFPTRIAEATNSQKPILPRDLKSNSPEMLRLARMLRDNGIYLEIKRDSDKKLKNFKPKYQIRNDYLAQIILSMVKQTPGVARIGSKTIFASKKLYNSVFGVNYEKDSNKKMFLLDLIQLYNRFLNIITELKKEGLTPDQVSVMKNATQVIFALIGVIYRLANSDVTEEELRQDKNIVRQREFIYGKFISNYSGDDLDLKLKQIIINIVIIITDSYRAAYDNNITTSVNYYLKSDSQYIDRILGTFINTLSSFTFGKDIKWAMDIFKRKL